MMRMPGNAFGLLVALVLAIACGQSAAQTYPSKPIKFVVQFTPGGAPDTLARLFGPRLGERVGQPVTVENRAGAAGIIASEYVKSATPDGYTLLVGATGPMVFNPGLYQRLSYDPIRDFVPIVQFETHPTVFAVHASVPANSLNDLIALARAKPGGLFYGSSAASFQVAAELLKKLAGINMVHVAFKGSMPAMTAAIAGDVQMVVMEAPTVPPQLQAGKIRALAVTSSKRSSLLPDIPTVEESGFPDYELLLWIGLFAPAGTPSAIVDKLHGELSLILNQDRIKERLVGMGYEPAARILTPAEFGAKHKADVEKWTKVARELKIRAD